MPALSLPPVPYHATAARPDWSQLPAEFRAAVTARLGAPITGVTRATGGFTRGFAGVLSTAAGERVFVKTAGLSEPGRLADVYAWEAAVTAGLPAGVRAARPRWTLTAAGHFALCLDAVDGRMPELPWTPDELDAALTAYAEAAETLRRPPPALVDLRPPVLSDLARQHLTGWQELAAAPTGAGPPATAGDRAVGAVRDRAGRELTAAAREIAQVRLPDLAELEARLPEYAQHPGMIHGDLRLDNVLVDRSGAAWICDWTWVCFGPAWFDLASLLVTAYASGLAADSMFAAHPAARDAPADGLDVALAALSGHWLTAAADGAGSASPHIRDHQRWSGEMALVWLAQRRGWR